MAEDTTITIIGNAVEDPELRFTPSGAAVAKFRVASTPRYMDRQSGEWKDGEALFLPVTVWRQAAENVAESVAKGTRVVVHGKLRQRQYEKDGQKRTVFELEADEVAVSLKFATAKVAKMQRSSGQSGRASAVDSGDPWATATPAGGGRGPVEDEPPF
jgi:single-strand DNA-binding protein